MSDEEKAAIMPVRNFRVESIEPTSSIRGLITFQAMDRFKIKSLCVKLEIPAETNCVKKGKKEIMESISCILDDATPREKGYEIEDAKNVQFNKYDFGCFKFTFWHSTYLPSSFDHEHARVRFVAEATLEVEGFNAILASGNLETPNFLELGCDPDEVGGRIIPQPIELKITEALEKHRPMRSILTVTAKAGSNAYIPGETIPLVININNTGKFEISKIEIVLYERVSIKTGQEENDFDRIIAESTKFPIENKEKFSYEHSLVIPTNYRVPVVAGPSMESYKIMENTYYLQMIVHNTSDWKPEIGSKYFRVFLGTERPSMKLQRIYEHKQCQKELHRAETSPIAVSSAGFEYHIAKIFKFPSYHAEYKNKLQKMFKILAPGKNV